MLCRRENPKPTPPKRFAFTRHQELTSSIVVETDSKVAWEWKPVLLENRSSPRTMGSNSSIMAFFTREPSLGLECFIETTLTGCFKSGTLDGARELIEEQYTHVHRHAPSSWTRRPLLLSTSFSHRRNQNDLFVAAVSRKQQVSKLMCFSFGIRRFSSSVIFGHLAAKLSRASI